MEKKTRMRNEKGQFIKGCKFPQEWIDKKVHPSGMKYNLKVINPTWFKKGFEPWNKGIPVRLSPKSEFKKGQHPSPTTEFKYKNGNGYRHPVFREYDTFCVECEKIFPLPRLHVHHIDGNRKNNSLDNLIVLCRPCHLKLHGRKELTEGYIHKR